MSSYYDLSWVDADLPKYTTDKLNFIYNTINHPLPLQYKQMMSRLQWIQAKKQHQEEIKVVKRIIDTRKDAHDIRPIWLKQHHLIKAKREGLTIEQLDQKLPYLADQLGAFMEIENIEIKYFDDKFRPRYDWNDFKDIFPAEFSKNGFKKEGITAKVLLRLYPNISLAKLNQALKIMGCEIEKQDGVQIIPYYYAVNAKRNLVDGIPLTKIED